MSDAIHASLREHVTALEKEITALRLGRLVGAPEGLSEVGTAETRIDVSELLDEVDQLKREKYAAIQHLDEAQRALVMADALLRQKYPGGLDLFGTDRNPELDQTLGALCASMLHNTPEAENFISFRFRGDESLEEKKRRVIVTVRYDDAKTTPEEVAHELREEVQRLRDEGLTFQSAHKIRGERIQDLEDELAAITQDRVYLRELETEVQRLRGRIAELEDDR